jgi:hypothetical protein
MIAILIIIIIVLGVILYRNNMEIKKFKKIEAQSKSHMTSTNSNIEVNAHDTESSNSVESESLDATQNNSVENNQKPLVDDKRNIKLVFALLFVLFVIILVQVFNNGFGTQSSSSSNGSSSSSSSSSGSTSSSTSSVPPVTKNEHGIVTHMNTPMNKPVDFSYVTTSKIDGSTSSTVDVTMSLTSAEKTMEGYSDYDEPSEGKEFLKVTLHIKNNGTQDFKLTTYDYPLVVNGTLIDADSGTYSADNPSSIVAGGEADYKLLYEIPVGATGMQVRYNALGDPLGSFVVQ